VHLRRISTIQQKTAVNTAILLIRISNSTDSTPPIGDSKTDIVRVARAALRKKKLFGTETFLNRNACTSFNTENTDFQVRLYHLF